MLSITRAAFLAFAVAQVVQAGKFIVGSKNAKAFGVNQIAPSPPKNYTQTQWAEIIESLKPKADTANSAGSIVQPASAGKVSQVISGQYMGGDIATLGQFPWQGMIYANTEEFSGVVCGASLIEKRWALTAASCVTNKGLTGLTLILGSINAGEVSKGSNALSFVQFVHPQYSSATLKNDIALLKLPNDVTFSSTLNAIKLPPLSDASTTFEGVFATAAGWSNVRISIYGYEQSLRYAKQTVVPSSHCMNVFESKYVTASTICATPVDDPLCWDDIGGPLIYKDSTDTWVQIGIISITSKSGECAAGTLSAYTRVTSFLGWIKETITLNSASPETSTSTTTSTTTSPSTSTSETSLSMTTPSSVTSPSMTTSSSTLMSETATTATTTSSSQSLSTATSTAKTMITSNQDTTTQAVTSSNPTSKTATNPSASSTMKAATYTPTKTAPNSVSTTTSPSTTTKSGTFTTCKPASLKASKPVLCSKPDFRKLHNCCNVPRLDIAILGKKNKSSCKFQNADVFNHYSLNKQQNGKANNAINFADPKTQKSLFNQACFTNCFLESKGLMNKGAIQNSALLKFLTTSNEKNTWSGRISKGFADCLEYTQTNKIPNFVSGKSNCPGTAFVLLQCTQMKSLEACPTADRKSDKKACAKAWTSFDQCKDFVFSSNCEAPAGR